MLPALVIVDIQRDYFPGGRRPLVGADAAAETAARLLAEQRRRGGTVVHVRHEGASGFLEAGTAGAEIDPRVAPAGGETVVVKHAPNAFLGTPLDAVLRAQGAEEVWIVGMMTSMCVDATVRAASDLGYAVTVAADACAAPDLEFEGMRVPGELVHAAFLAALGSAYARVVPAAALLG